MKEITTRSCAYCNFKIDTSIKSVYEFTHSNNGSGLKKVNLCSQGCINAYKAEYAIEQQKKKLGLSTV